ncbi:hypothetical protein RM545_12280 [Zunongwangia sp. F260]|uniref:Uncharacterized protein n=1 Tax=Autumnicola lenta TaxID=3075593 RepID=A0ABU3CNG3_9FLAO|nr:hypothetical protein [Zunongwangia sp. F260]MDT0647470.1 hypothetical protein [Zunongwangia sp. F260]
MKTTSTMQTAEVLRSKSVALTEIRTEAFKVTSDNMNNGKLGDVKIGDLLLGEELTPDHWENNLAPNKYGYVIISNGNSYHKDFINFDAAAKTSTWKSRNPAASVQDISLDLNDDCQMFKIIKIQA